MTPAALLTATLRCECCGRLATATPGDADLRCLDCAHSYRLSDAILHYHGSDALAPVTEVAARDRQAAGYLQHVKHPVQIANLETFLGGLPAPDDIRPALDLGCGPGPSTGLLLRHGWSPVSIDFSLESLRINAAHNADRAGRCAFVKADLRRIRFVENSVGLLVMTDFLQHIATVEARRELLARAFAALAPGGRFYLNFMNLNIFNRLKNDRFGAFAAGTIAYERLTSRDVQRILPVDVVVAERRATNTSHDVATDRMIARLPMVGLVARMNLLTGYKR